MQTTEERFRQVQKRAYEIYQRRDPNIGSTEGDWWAAELEIEGEERPREMGPARAKERAKWNAVTSHRAKILKIPHEGPSSGMNRPDTHISCRAELEIHRFGGLRARATFNNWGNYLHSAL